MPFRIRTVLTLLLVLAASAARGQDPAPKAPLGFPDVARLSTARQVRITADGQAVAFIVQVPRAPWKADDGPAWSELHVAEAGRPARPFVAGEVNVSQVAFGPGGRDVFFLAKRKGEERVALWSIPRDGGEAKKRLSFETDLAAFDLSPTGGGKVAFLAREKKAEAVEAREKKGFNQDVFEEGRPPVKVWLATLEGPDAPKALDLPGSASELRFSPSGDRLAVALAPTPAIDDEYMERKVHVVALDGAVLGRVAHDGKLGHVAWSPDGTRLAMIFAADRHDPSTSALAVVPATGGAPVNLLPDYEGHPEAFAWADASTLLVLGSRGVASELFTLPAAGGRATPVAVEGGLVLNAIARAASGTLALLGESPAHPAEAFVLPAGKTRPERRSDLNPWLAERRLAQQSVVRWKARDGLELEGLLLTPPDRAAGARVPLVVVVHGGPEAHFSNGWLTRYSEPGQLLAARGFAVFYPNYRGSTGRGLAFSKTSQADAAGAEFDDLVDGVDHLVAIGLADPKKVGITGGSYGGYAANWCATYYTERFAAAVSFVGISDLTSKAGTTDIPVEDVDVHMMSMPWTRFAENAKRSPLTYVEKARTPLLLLHGTDDPRVHPTQSLLLYRYLKLAGKVPLRYVRYPGEGHGNRRAASQLDLSVRLVQWFEHYLAGPGGAPPPAEIDYRKVLGLPDEEKK